jgi:hypothetical protein
VALRIAYDQRGLSQRLGGIYGVGLLIGLLKP